MLITLISAALFIAVVVLLIVGICKEWDEEIVGFCIGIPTLIATIIFGVVMLEVATAQIGRKIEYDKKAHERDMLVYRLEQAEEDNNVVEYAELYNDIVCFNNSIRKNKEWGDSLWVNWLFNPLIRELDYIEVINPEDSK